MFSTYHNLGFIHIYSHASILHIILPLITTKPFYGSVDFVRDYLGEPVPQS